MLSDFKRERYERENEKHDSCVASETDMKNGAKNTVVLFPIVS